MKEYDVLWKNKYIEQVERVQVPDGCDPVEEIKRMIKEYNDEEVERSKNIRGYKSVPREFVRLIGLVGDAPEPEHHCIMNKENMLTIMPDKGLAYDIYRCSRCGFRVKRIGFMDLHVPTCHPDRTCPACNRVFATAKSLQKHVTANKHKTPGWIDRR